MAELVDAAIVGAPEPELAGTVGSSPTIAALNATPLAGAHECRRVESPSCLEPKTAGGAVCLGVADRPCGGALAWTDHRASMADATRKGAC